jgi:SpoVK/Ycf46/Vps4 family AAA+-type ATPase
MSQPILSKGYCQCRSGPNRRKRGGRQTGEKEFHYGTTVALVLKNAKSGIFCRWNSSDTTSSVQAGDLLCYDETVCIVSNEDFGSSLHDVLFPPPNHSKLEAWSLDFSTDVSSCRYNERHSHATIREKIPSDRNSLVNHDDPKLLALEVTPINVLSLSIEVELNSSEDSSTTVEALLHAHWKRQLTGKIFLQANGLNTSIRLNNDISFRVKSLTPKTRTTPSMATFIVLPSTRITITKKTQIPRIIQRNPPNASMVTKLLVDIIHCVANRIPTSRTMLLSGPPGVGKTYSVKAALAHCYLNTKLVSLRGSELLQQQLNPARALEREFQMARSTAGDGVVLLFLDECDALVSVDSMAAMLATLLDRVDSNKDRLVVVGATNRIESIPNMLRRPGRFDCEIPLSPPNVFQRNQILSKVFQETLGLPSDFEKQEIMRIAELCVGYVPADLAALFRRAAYLARQDQSRDDSDTEQASTVNYLESAMNDVSASALRDAALAAPPNTSWDDIAGDPGNAKVSSILIELIPMPLIPLNHCFFYI